MRSRPVLALVAVVAVLAVSACTRPGRPTPGPGPSATPADRPSSFDLIAAGRASGALSAGQALLYEAYASFNDTRLPPSYRGAAGDEGSFMAHTAEAWAGLAAADQAALLPWTLPPYSLGSWWDLAHGGTPAPAAAVAAQPYCGAAGLGISTAWTSASGSGGVRVWWPKGDKDSEELATLVRGIAGDARGRTSAALNSMPVPDDKGTDCMGGTTELDIVVVDTGLGAAARTSPHDGKCPSSSYVTVSALGGEWDGTYLVKGNQSLHSVLAHEFSHVVLDHLIGSCTPIDDVRWFYEGTAVWVQRRAYPSIEPSVVFGNTFLAGLHQPLSLRLPVGGRREYGTWLFFFDLTQRYAEPGLIAEMYERTRGLSPVAAVAAVLAAPRRGLAADWRQFLLDAWNADEHDELRRWSGGKITSKAHTSEPDTAGPPKNPAPTVIDLGEAHRRTYKLADTATGSLAPMSGRYYAFDLAASKKVRWVRLRNPYADGKTGGSVRALIFRNGAWSTDDWSGRATVDLCQDHKYEKLDRLVVVVGNHDAAAPAAGTPELIARDTCDRDFTVSGTHTWTRLPDTPRGSGFWDADGKVTFDGDMHCALPDIPPIPPEWTCTGSVKADGNGTIYVYKVGTGIDPPDCQEPWAAHGLTLRFDGKAPDGPLDRATITRNAAGLPKDFHCTTYANATPVLPIDHRMLGGDLPLPGVGERLDRILPAYDPQYGRVNGQLKITVVDRED